MLNRKLLLSVFLILSALGTHPNLYAEDKSKDKDHDKVDIALDKEASFRAFEKGKDVSAQYDKLKDIFSKAPEAGMKLKAMGFDGKNLDLELSKDKELKELIDAVTEMKKYRTKLKDSKCDFDKSAELFGKVMDDYVLKLSEMIGEDRSKISTVDEKVINTFTVKMKSFLQDKKSKFDSIKKDFEKSDALLLSKLTKVAEILWKGKFREKLFNEKFTPEIMAADKSLESVLRETKEASDALIDRVPKEGGSKIALQLCKLDTETGEVVTSPTPTPTPSASATPTPTTSPAPPGGTPTPVDPGVVVNPGTGGGGAGGGGAGAGGAGAGAVGGQDLNGIIDRLKQELQNNGNLGLNQAKDALLAAQQAAADLERQRRDQDALNQILQDQNRNQNDILGRALEQLGQIQPPSNRSNERSNTDSPTEGAFSPSLSPSVESGKGGSPNVPPPPPLPPVPSMPPFVYPPQQPQPVATLPTGLGDIKRFDDEPRRPIPVPVSDPNTSALLELLKYQSQILMGVRQNQQMYPGVPNTNGNRISASPMGLGSRMVRGSKFLPMRGTALSGQVGSLGINPRARGKIPAALMRR